MSVGIQMAAKNGNTEGLFHAAIMVRFSPLDRKRALLQLITQQSGAPLPVVPAVYVPSGRVAECTLCDLHKF